MTGKGEVEIAQQRLAMVSEAHLQGRLAAALDLPARANPYLPGTPYSVAWCEGWTDDWHPHRGGPPRVGWKRSDVDYQGDHFHE